jgi:hypothetical protein
MPLILQALFWFAVISHMPGPRQAVRLVGTVVSNRGVSVPFLTGAGTGRGNSSTDRGRRGIVGDSSVDTVPARPQRHLARRCKRECNRHLAPVLRW